MHIEMCEVDGCTDKIHAKGMCQKHYRRIKKYGTLEVEREREYGGNNKTHPLYPTWITMRARCQNEKHISYKNYGARGIKVCPRWDRSFQAFLRDMGERPEGMTLDRVNNDGDYAPNNCRWATYKAQALNKRDRKNKTGEKGISFDAKTQKYRARRYNRATGKREFLGSTTTLEEAIALRDDPTAVAKNGVSGENNPAAKLKNWQWELVIQEALKGKKSQAQIARDAGVSPASLCRKLKAYKNK